MNKLLFLLPLLCAQLCLAQTPDKSQKAPEGNPAKFPEGDAQWTIDVSHKPVVRPEKAGPAPSKKSSDIQKIDVAKAGDISRTIVNWSDGKTTERWHYNSLKMSFVTDTEDGKAAGMSDNDRNMMVFLRTGFEPEYFSWIDPKYFQGVVTYQSKKCFYYKAAVDLTANRSMMNSESQHTETETFQAWIDTSTSLPVGFDDGIKVGIFSFGAAPSSLTPPKTVDDVLRRYTVPLVPPPVR